MCSFKTRLRRLAQLAIFASAGAATVPISAQVFPARPIRVLVGYNAGGGVDVMARLLAQGLAKELGQPVIVDNKAGASGTIAADLVSKAPPDGYTLLMAESGMLIISQLKPKPDVDPLKAFSPVAGVLTASMVLVANQQIPAGTPKEFLALIKSNPGKFFYATPGVGTVQQLAFEMIKAKSQSFVLHIPYKGASQIVPDVISGQVQFSVLSIASALPQVRAGRLKAIAILDDTKIAGAQGIPRMSDAIPGFSAASRMMVLAPLHTPPAVIAKLEGAVRSVVSDPNFVNGVAEQGGASAFVPARGLGTAMTKELDAWALTIKTQRITLE